MQGGARQARRPCRPQSKPVLLGELLCTELHLGTVPGCAAPVWLLPQPVPHARVRGPRHRAGRQESMGASAYQYAIDKGHASRLSGDGLICRPPRGRQIPQEAAPRPEGLTEPEGGPCCPAARSLPPAPRDSCSAAPLASACWYPCWRRAERTRPAERRPRTRRTVPSYRFARHTSLATGPRGLAGRTDGRTDSL